MIRFIKRFFNSDNLKNLEERVRKLEFIYGKGADDTVKKIQEEILEDLHKLKQVINDDIKSSCVGHNTDTTSLIEEIKILKEENSKLHYQISHLKRHID